MRWNGIVRIASIPVAIGVVAWVKYGLGMTWNVSALIGFLIYITMAIFVGIAWAMNNRRELSDKREKPDETRD